MEVLLVNTRETVADRIVRLCHERGIALNALARLSAVPPSTLKNIVNGVSHNPGIVTIKMLCDGLGITLGEFFSTEEFDGLEQEIR
jgi:transcriptional regulator with XRE-family HTH domain